MEKGTAATLLHIAKRPQGVRLVYEGRVLPEMSEAAVLRTARTTLEDEQVKLAKLEQQVVLQRQRVERMGADVARIEEELG
jgi:hypothetical protein